MAKVNHKRVKQLLNEKRSKISDRQFFTSRMLAGHFEDMAAAQTRRYHYDRRVCVNIDWKPMESKCAYTDHRRIYINAGNPFVTSVKGRVNRYQIVCGLFAHELGHVLYTDFLAEQTHLNAIEQGRWYPSVPVWRSMREARNEKDFWAYVGESEMNLAAVREVLHHISNVLEDGYIENRMLTDYPGTLAYGLEEVRRAHFEQMPTVTDLIEREDSGGWHRFESILQMLLSYAKFGEIKYGEEPLTEERIQTVFALLTDVDNALLTRMGKERLTTANRIIIHCWEDAKDYCETIKKQQEDAGAVTAAIASALGKISGGSEIGVGSGAPVAEPGKAEIPSATAGSRSKTRSVASTTAPSNEEEKKEDEEKDSPGKSTSEEPSPEGSVSGDPGEENGEIPAPMFGETESDGEAGEGNNADHAGEKQATKAEEGGRIPYHQTNALSVPTDGTVEYNPSYEREKYDRAAADIERILDRVAEKAAVKELENERLRELNDAAENISYGDIHAGVRMRVNRIAEVDDDLMEQFDQISEPLLVVSRQLQKSVVRQLKESRRGAKQTGLMMGRRLDAHALCRNDGKTFYKNALPGEIPELAVGLLLDESGSMSCGDRSTYARASAIILHDFCKSLGIPIIIYGHSTGSYGERCVDLFSYAEFENFDEDDKYRLMDISARNSNRDGAALRFVAEQLAKRPEEVKILILVSDGQPADYGYSGTAAEEDLRGIKREYQRKGILFLAAAIGDDKPSIERIYGDSFLDITDLNQLPVKLTAIVKKFIHI